MGLQVVRLRHKKGGRYIGSIWGTIRKRDVSDFDKFHDIVTIETNDSIVAMLWNAEVVNE